MLLFWKRGPEVWCWMLRAWTPPSADCLPLSIPKLVALPRRDQAARTPCELSGAEPNRTEPNLAEPLRGARPSRAHWVRAGDSVISRDSAAVCPSGWRLQAAGGWGSARCWFWCCAVPLLRDTLRGWVNTPGHTHTLTHARTHTHTRTGDPVMGQMLLLMHEWWAYRLLLWKSSKNVSNLFLIFNKSSEWRQTPSQYTRLY